jgi:hypothetical protein
MGVHAMSEEKLVFKVKTAAKIKNFLRITTENDSQITCFEVKDIELINQLEPGIKIRLTVWKNGIYTNGKDIEILGSGSAAAGGSKINSEKKPADQVQSENQNDTINFNEELKRFKHFMIELGILIDKCFNN